MFWKRKFVKKKRNKSIYYWGEVWKGGKNLFRKQDKASKRGNMLTWRTEPKCDWVRDGSEEAEVQNSVTFGFLLQSTLNLFQRCPIPTLKTTGLSTINVTKGCCWGLIYPPTFQKSLLIGFDRVTWVKMSKRTCAVYRGIGWKCKI